MRQMQIGVIAYKNALTGEYEKAMPIYKTIEEEQEFKKIKEELLRSVCEFFKVEISFSKNKHFKR